MCYPYYYPVVVPNTTTYYGPVKEGKRTISVYEGSSRQTYVADKKQADEYFKHETNYQNNSTKAGFGFLTAVFSSFFFINGKDMGKYCKPLGIAGAAIGGLYGLCKVVSAIKERKQALNVLNEIKQSQNDY